MSDPREFFFHGPEVELTWQIRLRLAGRRILHLFHRQRRQDWTVGEAYPPGTPFDVIMDEIMGRPGWEAEPGVGIHIEEGTE
jgi:hypothetical protein